MKSPELVQAQTDLRNSYLRLSDLCGIDGRSSGDRQFEAVGSLRYEPRHPTLNDTLARALIERPEIKSAEKDVAIEEKQLEVDRSATRPQRRILLRLPSLQRTRSQCGPDVQSWLRRRTECLLAAV